MTPFIKWQGSKRRLARQILPLFPPHQCYVELFCGGAALFFMRETPAPVEVLNDIDGELINLYRCLSCHPEEITRQVEALLISREIFERFKKTPPDILTDIQRAVRFYYLVSYCFGALRVGQNFMIDKCHRGRSLLVREKFFAAHRRLQAATIENRPWRQVLESYDGADSFFYADPPYHGLHGYAGAFPDHEYFELADAMRTMKGKMLLSINNSPATRAFFNGLPFRELTTTYIINGSSGYATPRKELLVANYEWGEPCPTP